MAVRSIARSLFADSLKLGARHRLPRFSCNGCNVVSLRMFMAECQNDPAFAKAYQERFLEPRREAVRIIWSRGVERGEIDPRFDCELVIDMVYAPMVYRLLAGHLPFTKNDAKNLVDAVFRGIALQKC